MTSGGLTPEELRYFEEIGEQTRAELRAAVEDLRREGVPEHAIVRAWQVSADEGRLSPQRLQDRARQYAREA